MSLVPEQTRVRGEDSLNAGQTVAVATTPAGVPVPIPAAKFTEEGPAVVRAISETCYVLPYTGKYHVEFVISGWDSTNKDFSFDIELEGVVVPAHQERTAAAANARGNVSILKGILEADAGDEICLIISEPGSSTFNVVGYNAVIELTGAKS